jgi:hypothetical protein
MSLRRIPAKVRRLEDAWLGSSPSTFLGTLSKGSSPLIWRFEGCFDSGFQELLVEVETEDGSEVASTAGPSSTGK